LEVLSRPHADRRIRSLGILAGGFNPPTRAHLALVGAAERVVDEVICVVPRIYPHKAFHGATLEQRLDLLQLAAGNPRRFGVAIAEKGLFAEIADEARAALGADLDVQFICGRDAADRIVNWDYGYPNAIVNMMERFGLLVANRGGSWTPPAHLAHRVTALAVPPGFDDISSTEVRSRLDRGDAWDHLVPAELVSQVRDIFKRP